MLSAVVVIPAQDEAARIEGCLTALSAQTVGRDAFELVLVLDRCADATETLAARAGARLGLTCTLLPGPGRGPGAARRIGMERAHLRLLESGSPRGLIASTDADTRVAPDWLARQLAHLAAGAGAVAGRIELDAAEAARLPAGVLAERARRAAVRLRAVRRLEPEAGHHHFGGASFGVPADVYARVGGLEARPVLEDAAFAVRLRAHGVRIVRADDVVVVTSARTDGRVARGLSVDLADAERRALAGPAS